VEKRVLKGKEEKRYRGDEGMKGNEKSKFKKRKKVRKK
jgi:hypothetical protein